ncbi:MAG: hypothetical protein ACLFSV_04930 [Alkalispirochaeta sp.]
MRRSEHYTVPDKLYSFPEPGTYRKAFHELPFLQRVYLRIRTWFGSTDIVHALKEHELDEIIRRITALEGKIIDPSIPALLDGFHTRVHAVAQKIEALKPVLAEVRGAGAGPFLREELERLAPDLYRSIDVSTVIPEELLTNAATTAEGAKAAVQEYLLQALEINARTIREHIDPVWNSLEALAVLSTVDFGTLVPVNINRGARIPIRPLKDPLINLACTIDLCMRNRRPDAIQRAAAFVTHRIGKRFSAQETIWTAIEALNSGVPLTDLVCLATDEPRLELTRISTRSGWWKRFTTAWIERIDVQSPLLRHRSIIVEELLRNRFGVTEPSLTWIPPTLFQRTLSAVRRLGAAQRFRDTRTLAGTLAREQGLMSSSDRARILEAHMELDTAYTRIEELTGIGESRGTIGDELRRVTTTDSAETMTGFQKMNVYSKHRPEIQVLLGQAIEGLTSISGYFERNRGPLKKALKSGLVRIDTSMDDLPPVDLLDLITDGYNRLAVSLRGLFTLEHELTAPTVRDSAGAEGDGAEGEEAEAVEEEDEPEDTGNTPEELESP